MRTRTLAALAAAATLALALSVPAEAIDVTPMVTRLTPQQAAAGYRLSVKNTSATPITIELTPFRMTLDENGMRTLVEEKDDLLLFPPQSIIPPNREQVVQIRYVGDQQISEPRMYLVRTAQLPVRLAADESTPVGAEVQVAFNVNTHLFVSPPGVGPQVTVTETKRAPNGDVLVTVRNDGRGIAHLRTARYAVTGAGGVSVEVDGTKVELGEVSAVQAGAVRHLRIPASQLGGLSGEVTATVVPR